MIPVLGINSLAAKACKSLFRPGDYDHKLEALRNAGWQD
jgi:hypothetical protein